MKRTEHENMLCPSISIAVLDFLNSEIVERLAYWPGLNLAGISLCLEGLGAKD